MGITILILFVDSYSKKHLNSRCFVVYNTTTRIKFLLNVKKSKSHPKALGTAIPNAFFLYEIDIIILLLFSPIFKYIFEQIFLCVNRRWGGKGALNAGRGGYSLWAVNTLLVKRLIQLIE